MRAPGSNPAGTHGGKPAAANGKGRQTKPPGAPLKKRILVPPALRPPRQPKVPGKRGAPFGNQNAFKHGRFTRERRALYAEIREHLRRGSVLIEALAPVR